MKTIHKLLMIGSFTVMVGCSLSRWLARPEHLATIDGTMAIAFWVLVIAVLIEAHHE